MVLCFVVALSPLLCSTCKGVTQIGKYHDVLVRQIRLLPQLGEVHVFAVQIPENGANACLSSGGAPQHVHGDFVRGMRLKERKNTYIRTEHKVWDECPGKCDWRGALGTPSEPFCPHDSPCFSPSCQRASSAGHSGNQVQREVDSKTWRPLFEDAPDPSRCR